MDSEQQDGETYKSPREGMSGPGGWRGRLDKRHGGDVSTDGRMDVRKQLVKRLLHALAPECHHSVGARKRGLG